MSLLNKSITSVAIATIALLGTTIVASKPSLAANLKSAEPSLDTIVDESYSVVDDEIFELPSGNIDFTFQAEFAGNAKKNVLGIYDVLDPKKRLTIFSGADTVGDTKSLKIGNNNEISIIKNSVTLSSLKLGGNQFGFFIDVPGSEIFYSESKQNPKKGNQSHTYRKGNDGIIAFEDQKFGISDQDFNDAVFLASGLWDEDLGGGVAEIPEPSTLFGLGLIVGYVAVSRRRQIPR